MDREGIDEFQATGTISWISYCLALKAEPYILRIVTPNLSKRSQRRKGSSKKLADATYLPNCIGCAVSFLPLLARTIPKLRLRSVRRSAPLNNGNRFHSRNALKQPTRNTADKKRVQRQDTDCEFRFAR